MEYQYWSVGYKEMKGKFLDFARRATVPAPLTAGSARCPTLLRARKIDVSMVLL
jgi:hypothetical protein